MRPQNTEMDLSISLALYFASRGLGVVEETNSTQPYQTNTRALLSGLGADELLGGYSRHAAAFRRNGYEALLDELDLDIRRLSKRNLGRDDRVVSHWGREIRYPFLDERVMGLLLECPVWRKCGFDEPSEANAFGQTKMLLRQLAWNLGLKKAAVERKRAIQFGARTARMGASRVRGTDVVMT